jgi:hypothetical protein
VCSGLRGCASPWVWVRVGNGRSHTHGCPDADAVQTPRMTQTRGVFRTPDCHNFRWTPSITGQSDIQYRPYPIPYATAEVLAYYTVSHRRPTRYCGTSHFCVEPELSGEHWIFHSIQGLLTTSVPHPFRWIMMYIFLSRSAPPHIVQLRASI